MSPKPITAAAAVLLTLALAACSSEDGSATDDAGSGGSTTSATPSTDGYSTETGAPTEGEDGGSAAGGADGTECTYTPDGQEPARPVEPPPATVEVTGQVAVTIETSAGAVPATLDADDAPCTVGSFLSLAEQGFYDDSPCPRITTQPGFQLLQCGDPSGTTAGGPGYYVPDELSGDETYPAGTLAMANIGQPDTNGSQFFIVYGDTQLPPQYTTFGTVDPAGLAVIEKVAAAGDDGSNPAGGGAPKQPIDITSIKVG